MDDALPAPVDRAAFEAALRDLRKDARNVALPGLAATYVALFGLIGVAASVDRWWVYLAVLLPVGWLQYRVVLSGHEAVHQTLCYPRPLNELLGVVGQALVGVNFAAYRVQHLDHHRATSLADDPDGHIYGGIIHAPRGWRRWLTYTLGTFVEIVVKVWQKGLGAAGTRGGRFERAPASWETRRDTVAVLGAQLGLLVGLGLWTGHWWGYFALWIAPLFGVAVFLNRSRILVEHGLALLEGGNEVARSIPTVDIVPPPWQRWLFAPFAFHYHCAHHLHLTVPHYNLARLHALLAAQGADGFHRIEGDYLGAIARAMRA